MDDNELLNILNSDINNSYINIQINNNIQNNLFDYQINHVQKLIHSINNNNISIDTSDTGCGKTYCSIALCSQLNLQPIILCPKSIINNWFYVCSIFKVKPLFICNYETIRNCKYYKNNKRINCPYIKIDDNNNYQWNNISSNNIFIFDEAHFCKSKKTLNSKLLISTLPYKKLLLSATLIDNMSSFEIFTYILGWCSKLNKTKSYLLAQTKNLKTFQYIRKKLYPEYASRISIKELGDKFPKNRIITDTYNCDKFNLINQEYQKIKQYYKLLDEKQTKNKKNILVDISFSRQKIELYKIEVLVDLTNQYLNNNYNIVIFVNFNKTIEMLSKILKTKCIIYGKQTYQNRIKNINDFQNNKQNIIISNISAGGQSINLHDEYGLRPRVSLIVPSYSSTQLVQALGRIHRANSKSPATQRIIFCSDTIEEHISDKLKNKINNLSQLNDNDLNIFN